MKNFRLSSFMPLGILLILTCSLIYSISPNYLSIPNRDEGVFLYISKQTLQGELPYRDVWDHKPPAIFLFTIIGLVLSGGSVWGTWLVELIFIGSSVTVAYIFLKQIFGLLPAIFGAFLLVFSLGQVLDLGYRVEEFALPFQFGAIFLFFRLEEQKQKFGGEFTIGVFGAFALLLKQNLIGIWLTILIILLVAGFKTRDWTGLLKAFATMALGGVAVILPFLLYFMVNSGLNAFVDQVFRYNFVYSNTPLQFRLLSGLFGIDSLSPISILTLLSWLLGIINLLLLRDRIDKKIKSVLTFAVIAFPIEFTLAALSGRAYDHYFIAWLPISSILNSYLGYMILDLAKPLSAKFRINFPAILLFILLGFLIWLPVIKLIAALTLQPCAENYCATHINTLDYIQKNSTKTDFVLIWGAETSLNFAADRQSPSRYAYQYPLYTPNYQTSKMVEEFLLELQKNKPILIIDTSSSDDATATPPLEQEKRQNWQTSRKFKDYNFLPGDMANVFDYISSNYVLVTQIGPKMWSIYKLK